MYISVVHAIFDIIKSSKILVKFLVIFIRTFQKIKIVFRDQNNVCNAKKDATTRLCIEWRA